MFLVFRVKLLPSPQPAPHCWGVSEPVSSPMWDRGGDRGGFWLLPLLCGLSWLCATSGSFILTDTQHHWCTSCIPRRDDLSPLTIVFELSDFIPAITIYKLHRSIWRAGASPAPVDSFKHCLFHPTPRNGLWLGARLSSTCNAFTFVYFFLII